MTFSINGTTFDTINLNGTPLDVVTFNATTVYESEPVYWNAPTTSNYSAGGGVIVSRFELFTNGEVNYLNSVFAGNWYTPTTLGVGSNYEAKFEHISGDTPYSTITSTWLPIGSSTFVRYRSVDVGVTHSGVCEIQVRDATTLDVIFTQNVSISALRTS